MNFRRDLFAVNRTGWADAHHQLIRPLFWVIVVMNKLDSPRNQQSLPLAQAKLFHLFRLLIMRNSPFIKLVAISAIAVACSSAFAADTAEIHVTGQVSPGTCTLDLGNNGDFDYGEMTSASLTSRNANAASTNTVLDTLETTFSLACDSPIKAALSLQDNRAGTADTGTDTATVLGATPSANELFGLSTDNSNTDIGSYVVGIEAGNISGTSDGAKQIPSLKLLSSDNGTAGTPTWAEVPGAYGLFTQDGRYVSWGTTSTAPEQAQTISGTIKVQAVLAPQGNLDDSYDLDGSATLSVQYL